MPEAPEVDALTRFLAKRVSGLDLRAVELEESRALKTRTRPLDGLLGRTVTGVARYGKHIDLDFDGVHLGIGFGRAGWATWTEADAAEDAASGDTPAAVIARLTFEGGVLGLTDGGEWVSLRLHVVDAPEDVPGVAALGPDAASPAFSRDDLARALAGRRKQLKALLQEQETLAGIGNAYSDEILHAARLSPLAHAAGLDADEITRLHAALHDELGAAVLARRTVPISQQKAAKVAAMRVHGRTGERCPVCGDTVRDIPGTRGSAQYCATCQTGGVALAESRP